MIIAGTKSDAAHLVGCTASSPDFEIRGLSRFQGLMITVGSFTVPVPKLVTLYLNEPVAVALAGPQLPGAPFPTLNLVWLYGEPGVVPAAPFGPLGDRHVVSVQPAYGRRIG